MGMTTLERIIQPEINQHTHNLTYTLSHNHKEHTHKDNSQKSNVYVLGCISFILLLDEAGGN